MVAYDQNPEDADLFWARELGLPIINNWRSSHGFPLNTFRVNLQRVARRIDDESLVAQRIKRLSSISKKLQRFPKMKFSQMQDIGGCRAVVRTVAQVREVADVYAKSSRMRHILVHPDDYIAKPAASGYRGIHLIYRYNSDRNEHYNDLKIEVQIRSILQHAWATAVETVGTFLQQALKSNIGEAEWLRFFALMGTVIAYQEGSPPVPGTPESEEALLSELYEIAINLDVENRLRAYMQAIQVMKQPDSEHADYYLLTIEPAEERVTVKGFRRHQILQATTEYLAVEKNIAKGGAMDAVLVSVDSAASLERAYPNYFADTHVFLRVLSGAMADFENNYLLP